MVMLFLSSCCCLWLFLVNQVVITGEWCREVLDEYMNPSDEASTLVDGTAPPKTEFLGRGLQYYLGFHHNDDACM